MDRLEHRIEELFAELGQRIDDGRGPARG